mmetsp:Transcript_50321/g.87484  ORF Transcript_50321/g.87484 Transcript_50321/m.87484 type:complete len:416 (-) Transcript_50321:82-1329(-)
MAKQPNSQPNPKSNRRASYAPGDDPGPRPLVRSASGGRLSSPATFLRQASDNTEATEATDGTEGLFLEEEENPGLGVMAGRRLLDLHAQFNWCSGLFLPAALIVGGYVFLKTNEGWSFLTTAYVMVQIVTTIGYGDVVVEQESSMLFMTIFSLAMLVIVAFNLDKIIQRLYRLETKVLTGFLSELEQGLEGNEDHEHDNHASLNKLVASCCITGSLAIFGTIFYSTYESCSCSSDVTRIEGCIETTYKACVETGGITQSLISTIYMVVMTFTTIGFGDFSLESKMGRGIGTVWMLLCVASTANLVSSINSYVTEKRTLHELLAKDILEEGKEVFDMIDKDNSGTLSRSEFIHYTLIKYGLISEEVIDAIEKEYDRLDSSGDGQVTYEMITQAIEDKKKRRAQRKAKKAARRQTIL